MARFPLPTWASGRVLRSWAWSSAHWGPRQPGGSWGSGREGRGSKSKGQAYRTSTPKGWLGEGRSSYTQWDPPMVRGPGRDGVGVAWKNRRERGHLGTREPVGLLGLILCPQSLPPVVQSPSPAPTPAPGPHLYTRRPPLRPPPMALGLNPTHTPSPRALPPNSRAPHSRRPPLDMLPLCFQAGPKQRSHPTFEHHTA